MDSKDEFFYNTFIDTSDESSDDDTEIMMVTATFIHNFNQDALPRHVGSVILRVPPLDRDWQTGHFQLWKDYFHPVKPTYPAHKFLHCFRMSKSVFMRLLKE